MMRLLDARGWYITFVPLDLVHLGRYTHALQALGVGRQPHACYLSAFFSADKRP